MSHLGRGGGSGPHSHPKPRPARVEPYAEEVIVRRTFLRSVLSLLVLGGASLAGPAAADEYPSRPIELVVGFAPGGGADNAARLIATYASQKFGQPVNVVNMPGASG